MLRATPRAGRIPACVELEIDSNHELRVAEEVGRESGPPPLSARFAFVIETSPCPPSFRPPAALPSRRGSPPASLTGLL